jgi:hypothetical protein
MLCDVCISINFFAEERRALVNVEDDSLDRIPVETEMRLEVFYMINYLRRSDFNFSSNKWDAVVDVHTIEIYSTSTKKYPGWYKMFEVYVEHECTPALARVISGRPSFPTPDSEGCFALINSWVRECTELHKGYCPPQIVAPLPTRVLDIGMDGDADSIFLKLADSAEVGAYVTLSHCVSLILSVLTQFVCFFLYR